MAKPQAKKPAAIPPAGDDKKDDSAAARAAFIEHHGLTEKSRCYVYHPDCPEGKIVEGAEAIAAAAEDGWSDAPPSE